MSSSNKKGCWNCGKTPAAEDPPLMRCIRCQKALYCSRDCQVAHWKTSKNGFGGHKKECPQLQAKKIEKGELKANFRMAGTFLAEENLEMVAEMAVQMSSNPGISRDKRAMFQNFARKLEPILALDFPAKRTWLSNSENVKEIADSMNALIPDAVEAFKRDSRELIDRVGSTSDPFHDSMMIAGRYVLTESQEPRSMLEIVQAVEPVLDALDALFHQKKNFFSTSSANTYMAKLDKLKTKVQDYSRMKTSDRLAYTPDSLFNLQET